MGLCLDDFLIVTLQVAERDNETSPCRTAAIRYTLGLTLQQVATHALDAQCSCQHDQCFLSLAVTAFKAAVVDDPEHHGALLRLRMLDGDTALTIDALPAQWVQQEYDEDFAKQFERKLVHGLAYTAHIELAEVICAAATAEMHSVWYDLGCGTGLCGHLLRPHAGWLVGVDLAPAMVAMAATAGVYDDVIVGDAATALLSVRPGSVTVAAAADVAVYIGCLAKLVEAASRALRVGGVFGLTVEELARVDGECAAHRDGGHMMNTRTGRFQHCVKCLESLCCMQSSAFDLVATHRFVGRREQGKEVEQVALVLRKNKPHSF